MTSKQALRQTAEKAQEHGVFNMDIHSETVLALLDEISELEQQHCGTALLEREQAHTETVSRLMDELEAKDRRIAELERGSKVIKCWSCQKSVTVDQVKAGDGYCPLCDCGIDLEEYETEELVAAGIITRIEG